jgi:hypothetical protein
MARGTEDITLAVSRDSMGYCFASLSQRERINTVSPSRLSPAREEGAKGEMLVSTHTRNILLSAWFLCALLVCIASTTVWSGSDKTIVDLERGLPEAPSRYHRPRAAHLYQYDKTEVDLAVPLPQQPAEEQRGSQRPATLPAPMPAPTAPPSQAPLPGGGR